MPVDISKSRSHTCEQNHCCQQDDEDVVKVIPVLPLSAGHADDEIDSQKDQDLSKACAA